MCKGKLPDVQCGKSVRSLLDSSLIGLELRCSGRWLRLGEQISSTHFVADHIQLVGGCKLISVLQTLRLNSQVETHDPANVTVSGSGKDLLTSSTCVQHRGSLNAPLRKQSFTVSEGCSARVLSLLDGNKLQLRATASRAKRLSCQQDSSKSPCSSPIKRSPLFPTNQWKVGLHQAPPWSSPNLKNMIGNGSGCWAELSLSGVSTMFSGFLENDSDSKLMSTDTISGSCYGRSSSVRSTTGNIPVCGHSCHALQSPPYLYEPDDRACRCADLCPEMSVSPTQAMSMSQCGSHSPLSTDLANVWYLPHKVTPTQAIDLTKLSSPSEQAEQEQLGIEATHVTTWCGQAAVRDLPPSLICATPDTPDECATPMHSNASELTLCGSANLPASSAGCVTADESLIRPAYVSQVHSSRQLLDKNGTPVQICRSTSEVCSTAARHAPNLEFSPTPIARQGHQSVSSSTFGSCGINGGSYDLFPSSPDLSSRFKSGSLCPSSTKQTNCRVQSSLLFSPPQVVSACESPTSSCANLFVASSSSYPSPLHLGFQSSLCCPADSPLLFSDPELMERSCLSPVDSSDSDLTKDTSLCRKLFDVP